MEVAKTEINLTSHFEFLAERHGVKFRPFKDTKAQTSKFPQIFSGIYERDATKTAQHLIAAGADRLFEMSSRLVVPAIEKAKKDMCLRPSISQSRLCPSSHASNTQKDIFEAANQQRVQEALGPDPARSSV